MYMKLIMNEIDEHYLDTKVNRSIKVNTLDVYIILEVSSNTINKKLKADVVAP